MRSHGSAGPNGAYFLCSVIANREYKIKMRCARLCKFIPALAAQPFGRQPRPLQYLDRLRPNLPCWMATCAVRGEIWRASMIQNGLGHNRARRITGTQKQNVVASLHFSVTLLPRQVISSEKKPIIQITKLSASRTGTNQRTLSGLKQRETLPCWVGATRITSRWTHYGLSNIR